MQWVESISSLYIVKMRGNRLKTLLLLTICCMFLHLQAQNTFKAIVLDSATHEKLEGVAVKLTGGGGAISDSAGKLEIRGVGDGKQTFEVSFVGYSKKRLSLNFPLKDREIYKIELAQEAEVTEEVVISATRMNSRIEDAPIKAEVLGAEDLAEESSLQPGNVSSMLSDVSGVQIQQTSVVSGNSVVRMQGLDGRYTMLLRDGLPAFIGLSGGLNILQIPPLDLKQIEIIKGPASTINGAGAIAGLINFVSKTPSDSTEAAFVLNQSSLLETNFDAYFSGKGNKIGYTLFTGFNHQFAVDVNKDGFSDVPKNVAFLVHPQIFFYPNNKTQFRLGVVVNYEDRTGGDMKAIKGGADTLHQYFEKNISENYGLDWILSHQFPKDQEISFKGDANYFKRDFTTNISRFDGIQWSGYGELYYALKKGRHNFLAGTNYLFDMFQSLPGNTTDFQTHTYHTLGLFTQYNYVIENKLNLQLGLRGDWMHPVGYFVLPSAAVLVHATKELSFRVNGGTGYLTPDLIDIAGMNENITSYIGSPELLNEYSYGGTVEWTYKKLFAEKGVSLFINQTFFYTWVRNAIIERYFNDGTDSVYNVKSGALSLGIDNYIRIARDPIEVYLGYTFTYPRKNSDKFQPYLTLTPLHRAAAVVTANLGKGFKIGVEGSVYGKQHLDDGSLTKPYFLLAASLSYKIKKVTLVLNGENLLNVRQSHYGAIVHAPYSNPTFSQLWAPTTGAVVNFSIMVRI